VCLGLLESLSAGYWSSAYKDVAAFVVLLLVLFVRPKGCWENIVFNRKRHLMDDILNERC
jgi:branched-subunit amino acid ABC-type transport system permease component